MGSLWERMPPDVVEEVMEQLKGDRGASAVFRETCKGWRDAHDQRVTRLSGSDDMSVLRLSSFVLMTRFQRVKEIGVRFWSSPRFTNTFYAKEWLRTFTSLTALITSLNLL